ncbi:MAG TPA: LemA family protein [Clostridia bacterium]
MIASINAIDIIVIALVAVILLLLVYIVAAVNGFKRLLIKIASADDKVEECLKRRYELLTKVKDFVPFDAVDFDKNMTIDQKIIVNRKLNEISANVLNSDKFKSINDFGNIIDGLKESERQLQSAIDDYNLIVDKFNHRLTLFPSKVIANIINLKPVKVFES